MATCHSPPPTAPACQPGTPTPPPQTDPAMRRGRSAPRTPASLAPSLSRLLTHKGLWGGAAARPVVPIPHHSPPLQPWSPPPQNNMPSRPWRLSRPWVTWGAVPDTPEEEMGAQHGQFPPSHPGSATTPGHWVRGPRARTGDTRWALGAPSLGVWLSGPPRAMSSGL